MKNSSGEKLENDDVDLATLGAALWRAKGWIVGLALGAGALTFIALSMMRPLYTSEARILIQNEETAFTRPTTEQGSNAYRTALDEQAVQSQVQVLTSRDLILKVVRDLDLTQNDAFMQDAGDTILARLMKAAGLSRGTPESEEERAANALAEHLDVYQLSKSSVIALEYTSGDPQLAAKIANTLADVYIAWQREAKIDQTKDATAWLDAQIKALRTATADAEEAVESFKASKGLYAGTNNVTLNAQQLSELNSQLILAEAQESEARARAKLIKDMLAKNGDIDATPEVMSSQVVINLIEQRVLVQRQLAELSATLLPSHPRIQQLRSELADVRAQIRIEAQKVVKGLENQAQVAAAREASLRASLDAAKSRSVGQSDAEVKLRALEREAKANRDLLESYLARYRDASTRHDLGSVPAQAAIVSRAHASVLPSFPRKGPITLLVIAAMALLAIGSVLAKSIIVSGVPERRERSPMRHEPDELVPSEPEYMSRAEMLALSRMDAAERRRRVRPTETLDKAPEATSRTVSGTPAEANEDARQREISAPRPEAPQSVGSQPTTSEASPPKPVASEQPAPKAESPASSAGDAEPAREPIEKTTAAVTESSVPEKIAGAAPSRPASKSVWRPSKPAKRPSWLKVNEPRSAALDEAAEKAAEAPVAEKPSIEPKEPTANPVPQEAVAQETVAQEAVAHEPVPQDKAAVEAKTPVVAAPQKTEPQKAPPPKAPPQETVRHDVAPEAPSGMEPAGREPLEQTAKEAKQDTPGKPSSGALATLAALAATGASLNDEEQEPERREPSVGPKFAEAGTPSKAPPKPVVQETPPVQPVVRNEAQAAIAKTLAREPSKAEPVEEAPKPASTADFIQRLRKDVSRPTDPSAMEAEKPGGRRSGGFLERFRGKSAKNTPEASAKAPEEPARIAKDPQKENEMAALSPNDLRHYLTQRVAGSDAKDEFPVPAKPAIGMGDVGPVLGSVDAVIGTVLESSTGGLPRTLLVAGTSARAQSPEAAIAIARDLADRNEQVALVDLAKGSSVVSGRLSMPRVPGFADLAAGKVEFTDVVRLDEASTLQVIPAGNPAVSEGFHEPDAFMRIFEALTQAYDCVVLHADMASIESLMPALKFELPMAVAVLPAQGSVEKESQPLSTIQRLGCPVVVYEPGRDHKKRRFTLFGRKVAV